MTTTATQRMQEIVAEVAAQRHRTTVEGPLPPGNPNFRVKCECGKVINVASTEATFAHDSAKRHVAEYGDPKWGACVAYLNEGDVVVDIYLYADGEYESHVGKVTNLCPEYVPPHKSEANPCFDLAPLDGSQPYTVFQSEIDSGSRTVIR